MIANHHIVRRAPLILAVILATVPQRPAAAQSAIVSRVGRDTVIVVAGPTFAAGPLHRKLLGDNYRDLWTTPIRVPVLDLKTFAGGIAPLKIGGGKQTRSLGSPPPTASSMCFAKFSRRA